jgi:hypothetical protein
MLLSAQKLQHFTLRAMDGEIGRVHDFYFDDQQWVARYLVADTRHRLPGRQVLISPASLDRPEPDRREVPVFLTMDQIRNSPGIETDCPVSRQMEGDLSTYYGWPMYWSGGTIAVGGVAEPMTGITPAGIRTSRAAATSPGAASAVVEPEPGDPHLRSMRDLIGYRIQAVDAEVGHLDDFLLDPHEWAVRYLVVDTRNWLPGRKVLVAPPRISRIVWEDAKVHVDLPQQLIRTAPEYEPDMPVTRDYETALDVHYNRERYDE